MSFNRLFKSRLGAIDNNLITALLAAIAAAGILGTVLNQEVNDAERSQHFRSAQKVAQACAKFVTTFANANETAGTYTFRDGIPVSKLTQELSYGGRDITFIKQSGSDFLISLESLIGIDASTPLITGGTDPSQVGVDGVLDSSHTYHVNFSGAHVQLWCSAPDVESDSCHTVVDGTPIYQIENAKVIDIQVKVNLTGGTNRKDNFVPNAAATVTAPVRYIGTLNTRTVPLQYVVDEDNSDNDIDETIAFSYLKMFDNRSNKAADDVTGQGDVMGNDIMFMSNKDLFDGNANLSKIANSVIGDAASTGGHLTASSDAHFKRTGAPSHVEALNCVSPLDLGELIPNGGVRETLEIFATEDPDEL